MGKGIGKTGQETIFQGIMMIHVFDKIQIFEVIYAPENFAEISNISEAPSVSGFSTIKEPLVLINRNLEPLTCRMGVCLRDVYERWCLSQGFPFPSRVKA